MVWRYEDDRLHVICEINEQKLYDRFLNEFQVSLLKKWSFLSQISKVNGSKFAETDLTIYWGNL